MLELFDYRAGGVLVVSLALLMSFGCDRRKTPNHAAAVAGHAPTSERGSGEDGTRHRDETAIREWASAFAAAWNRHEATPLASAFAADATLSSASGRLARGRRDIEQLFAEEQLTSMKGTAFAWTQTKIVFLAPDTALFDAECNIRAVIENDEPEPGLGRFRVTVVLKKQENTWRVHPCLFTPLSVSSATGTGAPIDANRDILRR